MYNQYNDHYRAPQPSGHSIPYSALGQQTLNIIHPAISHGLKEAQHLGFQHALTEAVAIGYLMGKGYDYNTAWRTVESWWRPHGTPLPTSY